MTWKLLVCDHPERERLARVKRSRELTLGSPVIIDIPTY